MKQKAVTVVILPGCGRAEATLQAANARKKRYAWDLEAFVLEGLLKRGSMKQMATSVVKRNHQKTIFWGLESPLTESRTNRLTIDATRTCAGPSSRQA